MAAIVPEVFRHGRRGVRGEELHRRGVGRCRGDDDRVVERAVLFQLLDQLGDGRPLLSDGDVNAIELFGFVLSRRIVVGFLVEDRVQRQSRLAGLAVADDQLALAPPDRDHRIDRFQSGRHRLVDGPPRDDARRLHIRDGTGGGVHRPFVVDRISERVHNPAQQGVSDRNVHDGFGPFDRVAFADVPVVAEYDDADIVGLEIERHPSDAARELNHFAGLDIVQTMHPGDAVAHAEHLSDLGDFRLMAEILDLLFQNRGNFSCLNAHSKYLMHNALEMEQP